jgi:excisionase family DNA binding protein
MELPPTLTVNQVAELLQVYPGTVRRNIEWGQIPAKKIGRIWRIPRAFVLEYLQTEGDVHAAAQASEHTHAARHAGER